MELAVKSLPSQEQLRELFDYVEDGTFVRRMSVSTTYAGERVEGSSSGHVRVDGVLYKLNRLIWQWHYGTCPHFLDHRDRDRANNRIGNLRPITRSQNNYNSKLYSSNTTGHRNVYVDPVRGGFLTIVSRGGKAHKRCTKTLEEALGKRDELYLELGIMNYAGAR